MKDIRIFLDTDVLACGDISPGFQSHIGSLACMLPRLHVMDSSDSPLVQYLLTCTMKNFNLCTFFLVFSDGNSGNSAISVKGKGLTNAKIYLERENSSKVKI